MYLAYVSQFQTNHHKTWYVHFVDNFWSRGQNWSISNLKIQNFILSLLLFKIIFQQNTLIILLKSMWKIIKKNFNSQIITIFQSKNFPNFPRNFPNVLIHKIFLIFRNNEKSTSLSAFCIISLQTNPKTILIL